MILNAENPDRIAAIPKNTKLTPIRIDTNPVLKIGKIIKINPKIMDNIPADLLASIFFPPYFIMSTFSSERFNKSKSDLIHIIFIYIILYKDIKIIPYLKKPIKYIIQDSEMLIQCKNRYNHHQLHYECI